MKRRAFLESVAAFAAGGCLSEKRSEAVTAATPVVPWQPARGAKKIRVVQWGMRHEHASGKFNSLKLLPEDFELAGIVDDRDSKTAAYPRDFKRYDGIPRLTPEQVAADASIRAAFVEVTNDDLVPVAWKCAKMGLAMHLDKPGGQTLGKYAALMDFCRVRGIPVQMGYMFRVNPAIRFAQKAVREGWLGALCSVEADMNHNYGDTTYSPYIATFKSGVLYNLGCHLVDFILPLFGDALPVEAHPILLDAPGDPAGTRTNGMSVLVWPHATATIRSCSEAACSLPRRQLRICGTKGMIELCPLERFDGKPLKLALRLAADVPGYRKGEHLVDFGVQKDRYADQLREFAQIVRGERKNAADQYDHDVAVHKATLMACGML